MSNLGLISTTGNYKHTIRSVLVLAHGRLPTTDIYVEPRLRELRNVGVRYVDTRGEHPRKDLIADGTFVIIVRHAPRTWLQYLIARRESLAGVAWLLDDDIPGVLDSSGLPWRYAIKTAYRYITTKRLLGRLCDAVWVATPYLQQKYAAATTRLVEPCYIGTPYQMGPGQFSYFYHGTASHRREIAWLVEVVRAVQARIADAQFEIMGGAAVRRLFQGIPRVRVINPMPWPEFLAHTSRVRYAVGLAPMLDSGFNRARSYNKMFDITRCGAAGVYSDVAVYRDKVQNGVAGILCPNDEGAWVEAICRLLADEAARIKIYRNALACCVQHASDPEFKLVELVGNNKLLSTSPRFE